MNVIQVLQTELGFHRLKYTQSEVREILIAFCDTIRDFAKSGEELNLPNVGKFYIKIHPGREVPDNLNGGTVMVPDRKRFKFKASKNLNDMINRR